MKGIWRKLRPGVRRRLAGERGFSLLELVVVVLIVAILAVIAIPSITLRMKDRQAQEVAHRVSAFYRNARMRAMGRGAAVLMRFDGGRVEVREARLGTQATDANCAPLPSSSCLNTSWVAAGADNHLIAGQVIDPLHYPEVKIEAFTPAGAVAPSVTPELDICFTPLGRAFYRTNQAAAFLPLNGTASAQVYRTPGGAPQGLTRTVMLLPNGASRLAL